MPVGCNHLTPTLMLASGTTPFDGLDNPCQQIPTGPKRLVQDKQSWLSHKRVALFSISCTIFIHMCIYQLIACVLFICVMDSLHEITHFRSEQDHLCWKMIILQSNHGTPKICHAIERCVPNYLTSCTWYKIANLLESSQYVIMLSDDVCL